VQLVTVLYIRNVFTQKEVLCCRETNYYFEPPQNTQKNRTEKKLEEMIAEEVAIARKIWTVKTIAGKRFHLLCFVESLYPKVKYCNRIDMTWYQEFP
jgi:hypothetical protein